MFFEQFQENNVPITYFRSQFDVIIAVETSDAPL